MAYLNRQYRTIGQLAIVVAVVMGVLVAIFEKSHQVERGIITALAFLFGASLSGISGYIGMYVAVRSNIRTAAAAREEPGRGADGRAPRRRGLRLPGRRARPARRQRRLLARLSLFARVTTPAIAETPFWIVGFAFGASFVALFAQLGGGIYTKAADVGADLVGKVEAGIPEDDPRNPAVIADLVGDNVGDCAGRGADLFESSAAEIIGAMILGVALFTAVRRRQDQRVAWIFFPLVLARSALICLDRRRSRSVRPSGDAGETRWASSTRASTSTAGAARSVMLRRSASGCCRTAASSSRSAASIGLADVASPSSSSRSTTPPAPTGRCRRSPKRPAQGPATNIISGIAVGFETTGAAGLTIGVALLAPTTRQRVSRLPESTPVLQPAGIFGTAVATMGMLMSAAYILAMDTFGPITDNAGGIIEMSNQPEASATSPTRSTRWATRPRRSPRATPSAPPAWRRSCSSRPT